MTEIVTMTNIINRTWPNFFLSQPPTLIVVSIGNMNVCCCHKFYELYQVTITYIFGNILTCIWSYHFGHVKQPLYFPLFYYFVLFIFCFILFRCLAGLADVVAVLRQIVRRITGNNCPQNLVRPLYPTSLRVLRHPNSQTIYWRENSRIMPPDRLSYPGLSFYRMSKHFLTGSTTFSDISLQWTVSTFLNESTQ